MNCGVKNAVLFNGLWLHPKSDAFYLHKIGDLKRLAAHLKSIR